VAIGLEHGVITKLDGPDIGIAGMNKVPITTGEIEPHIPSYIKPVCQREKS
jgi:hypothetical protein